MTGESIELKKETMDMCEVRLEEKLEEEKFHRNEDKRTSHDLPSPILLSGTQIETGEGYFMVLVIGKNCSFEKNFVKIKQENRTNSFTRKTRENCKGYWKGWHNCSRNYFDCSLC